MPRQYDTMDAATEPRPHVRGACRTISSTIKKVMRKAFVVDERQFVLNSFANVLTTASRSV